MIKVIFFRQHTLICVNYIIRVLTPKVYPGGQIAKIFLYLVTPSYNPQRYYCVPLYLMSFYNFLYNVLKFHILDYGWCNC